MNAPPRRRWFRFGLRTMFVVVTVLAIPLGWLVWHMQIVRERKAVFAEVTKRFSDQHNLQGDILPHHQVEDFELARISWIRRLLGDRPHHCINLSHRMDRKLIERAERAFPEAEIYVYLETIHHWSDFRDSLFAPAAQRKPNTGTIFKTGLIEKQPLAFSNP